MDKNWIYNKHVKDIVAYLDEADKESCFLFSDVDRILKEVRSEYETLQEAKDLIEFYVRDELGRKADFRDIEYVSVETEKTYDENTRGISETELVVDLKNAEIAVLKNGKETQVLKFDSLRDMIDSELKYLKTKRLFQDLEEMSKPHKNFIVRCEHDEEER